MVGSSMVGGPCGEGIGVGIRQEDDDLVTRFYEAIAVAKEAARSARAVGEVGSASTPRPEVRDPEGAALMSTR